MSVPLSRLSEKTETAFCGLVFVSFSAASDHTTLCLGEGGALTKVDKVSVFFFFLFSFFLSQRHVALHAYTDWEHY